MDESLIDKLKKVIEQHNQETEEKVQFVHVDWFNPRGEKEDSIFDIRITISKD